MKMNDQEITEINVIVRNEAYNFTQKESLFNVCDFSACVSL